MNVLFLLHGVGQHADGWTGDPVGALENAMGLYPECFPAGTTLNDRVKVVEIRYDDIFDIVLERWAELGNSLPTVGGAFGWTSTVSALLQQAGESDNKFARFGGDVVLYAGFPLIARAVRLRISARIASTMHEEGAASANAWQTPPKFGLVAHSLGTAIAQDALYQLATGQWTTEQQNLGKDIANVAGSSQAKKTSLTNALTSSLPSGPLSVDMHGLFLISDTSPVLHQSGYYSEHQTNGVYDCHRVWSVNHDFDPISHVGGAFSGNWRIDRKDVRLQHFHDRNIHAFAHYLSHPKVHSEIFQLLIPGFDQCYPKAQSLAAGNDWKGFGGALAAEAKQKQEELKRKLREASNLDRAAPKLRDAIEAYFKSIGLL
jgi:hypothetical protein